MPQPANPNQAYGVLRTIKQSDYHELIISLTKRSLRYSRHPSNNVKYPDPFDRRCPQWALHVTWVSHNQFEQDIDWNNIDGMIPIVQAIAGVTIRVNGVELTGDKSNTKLGRLHTEQIFLSTQSLAGPLKEKVLLPPKLTVLPRSYVLNYQSYNPKLYHLIPQTNYEADSLVVST